MLAFFPEKRYSIFRKGVVFILIRNVLFDLDGTLLPMDMDVFVEGYLKMLAQKMAPRGIEPKALIGAIWDGTHAMMKNDGSRTNEQVFWERFNALMGESAADREAVEEFYRVDFQRARALCGFDPMAARAVRSIKNAGMRVALATNPLFPRTATESRIRWAGLEPDDFELITTYEDSCACKPSRIYYSDVCGRLGMKPEESLMVGNDMGEDTAAAELGMKVFVITAGLIPREGKSLEDWPHGDFHDLLNYLHIEEEK